MLLILAIILLTTHTFRLTLCDTHLWSKGIGAVENNSFLNPKLFFPCLIPICDEEYGCFEPVNLLTYPVTMPPLFACPEVEKKDTVRFLVLSKNNPTEFTTIQAIEPGSKVNLFFTAYYSEYDSAPFVTVALALLKKCDHVVVVDWSRLGAPPIVNSIRPFYVSGYLALTNTILVGRIGCKFIKYLSKIKRLDPSNIFGIGYSAGGSALGFYSDFCRENYSIRFKHLMALDLPSFAFRRSNYALTNHTHADFVDILLTTVSIPVPVIDELISFTFDFGLIEVLGDCVYIVNPQHILGEQPKCEGILPTCSHLFSTTVFISAYSRKCLFRFSPCPPSFNIWGKSSSSTGYTRLDCTDHPYLKRTCIYTSPNPIQAC
ncbi:phospholipase A1 VesT1.02-like [Brevipalpus obovatus]|uniref:phospholipase A1 VesT1.02-like n=1 Tax=Brevipalpus obovatus TaxID=246614 RepID=UPI003D9DC64E